MAFFLKCYFFSLLISTIGLSFLGMAGINWLAGPMAIYCLCGYLIFIFLAIFNRHLGKWACDDFGWHLEPYQKGFDGCSANGRCPRCNKRVMLDSQGNWFASYRQDDNNE